jgi:hypothetical protein
MGDVNAKSNPNVNACARLGNDLFWTLDGDTSGGVPRQRNHFTVIFDRQGKLIVGRDVLIHDPDLWSPTGSVTRRACG